MISQAMRRFVGIDLGREPAPDETTVCRFRHLLEAHGRNHLGMVGEIIPECRATPPESAHIGVDSCTKLIHAVVATPANVADSRVLPQLLHGRETRVWGDQAYRGQRAVIRQHAPRARDFTNRRYRYRGMVDLIERAKNRTKSKVRARVEHSIGRQAGLRLCQGARSRAQQERAPAAGDLRPRQFVHRPVPSAARTAGVVRLKPAAAA